MTGFLLFPLLHPKADKDCNADHAPCKKDVGKHTIVCAFTVNRHAAK